MWFVEHFFLKTPSHSSPPSTNHMIMWLIFNSSFSFFKFSLISFLLPLPHHHRITCDFTLSDQILTHWRATSTWTCDLIHTTTTLAYSHHGLHTKTTNGGARDVDASWAPGMFFFSSLSFFTNWWIIIPIEDDKSDEKSPKWVFFLLFYIFDLLTVIF